MEVVKPWYMSRTVWGGLVAVGASLGALIGAPVPAGDQQVLADAMLQLIGAGGAVLAIFGRIAASTKLL